jgi:putative ABC transport system permease protein
MRRGFSQPMPVGDRLVRGLMRHVGPIGAAGLGSEKARLAWKNLIHSGTRWLVSLAAIAFAAFLMTLEGSLLVGFTRAASRVIDAAAADIWIVRKGSPAFEFLAPIPERYAAICLGIEGVTQAGRAVAATLPLKRGDGTIGFVFLVGIEDEFRGLIPSVAQAAAGRAISDSAIMVDETDRAKFGHGDAVQISGLRGTIAGAATGFSSFLGTPIVLASYADAHRYARLDRTDVNAIVVRVAGDGALEEVAQRLQRRLPDMDVWTADEFAWRSRWFWLNGTGAGAALTLAAILGFAVGLAVVAQTIYALTAEKIEEFALLRSMGAEDADVHFIVLAQSIICGGIGGLAGLSLVRPFAELVRTTVTWMVVPPWMYVLVSGLVALLCVAAARIAVRPALSADPGRVLRA